MHASENLSSFLLLAVYGKIVFLIFHICYSCLLLMEEDWKQDGHLRNKAELTKDRISKASLLCFMVVGQFSVAWSSGINWTAVLKKLYIKWYKHTKLTRELMDLHALGWHLCIHIQMHHFILLFFNFIFSFHSVINANNTEVIHNK